LPVSAGPQPPVQANEAETARQKVNRLLEEVARLAETELPPREFFDAFLKRVLGGLAARAAAVWLGTEPGDLQLHTHLNLPDAGIDQHETGRRAHAELLRHVRQLGQALHLPPRGVLGYSEEGGPAGNPSDLEVLFAPLVVDNQVAGLVEVWQPAEQDPAVVSWYVQFLARLAGLASVYLGHYHTRRRASQQQLWEQLEAFTRQIHGSLNPTEVAYLVANEGRRLVDCDRLSVGLRRGRRLAVEAISGADVVEKQASLVQLMRRLMHHVADWGEPVVYAGARDDSLPPAIVEALDAYLAASPSKLLAVFPLRDEREGPNRQPRSALLMECFHPITGAEPFLDRLEVVGRHAAGALYNAVEYRRIPLAWVWRPLARLQEGLGGKTRALLLLFLLAATGLATALVRIPYPLKLEARGKLLPEVRRWVYSPLEGQVVRFEEGVQPGRLVAENQALVLMYDVALEVRLVQLTNEIAGAQQAVEALARQEAEATSEADRLRYSAEKRQKEFLRDRKLLERKALNDRTHADETRPGYFWLTAPLTGTLLNSDFRENLTHRSVKPSEPLLRIGDKTRLWEVELKIPQQHIGHLIEAFDPDRADAELDVDLKLVSAPTRSFRGKLSRRCLTGQATPDRDDVSHPEPVVRASVRISGPDIPDADRIPPDLLVTGTEVRVKIRCGDHALGYSLFHGLWEFVNEKVALFF
jgi:hypothetical protein